MPDPYVGPRPFERTDAQFFFAREAETRELLSLVVADRVVLLYAASGAGKSSLLNAGLVPLLEREETFEVFPTARIRGAIDEEELEKAANVYMLGVLSTLNAEAGETGDVAAFSPRQSLAEFLAERPHAVEDAGMAAPRALIFDQFEEVFTRYPTYWRQREAFFEQIRQALEEDSLLRIVLAIREDYLAQLDPYAQLLPGALRGRLRLERLGPEQALSAVVKPLLPTPRRYAPGVAEKLVSDLLRFRVDRGKDQIAEVEGEFVEPVQLQVACQSLWSELPPEVEEITEQHLHAFGDVDEVLIRFYDGAASAAAAAARLREGRLRKWIEDAFITTVGTRSTIYRTAESTAEIPNAAIEELENRHLIRAEYRAGARWYELTHDRLISPIQSSNARFRKNVARRRRQLVLISLGVLAPLCALALLASFTSVFETAPAPSARVLAADMTLNFPEASYRKLINQPQTLSQRSSPGNLLTLKVTSHGYDGKLLVLRSSTLDATTHRPVGNPNEQSVAVAFRPPSNPAPIWLPLPKKQGRYAYVISLTRSSGSAPLSRTVSEPFKISVFGAAVRPGRALVNLKVSKAGRGNGRVVSSPAGIDCGNSCVAEYQVGSVVSLIAQPGAASRFAGWEQGCATSTTCTLTIDTAASAVAVFAPRAGTFQYMLGRSVRGRPIRAVEVGDPAAVTKVLVIGCVHGDECAGTAIAALLAKRRPSKHIDLWIVQNLNPDGFAAAQRTNAHGVDLNRNFAWKWQASAVGGDPGQAPGPRAFSEPESRIARDLILRLRPQITIWYHTRRAAGRPAQVDTSVGNSTIEQRYAELVGFPPVDETQYPGGATSWETTRIPKATAFVVELPFGKTLPRGEAKRHADAVIKLTQSKTVD